MITDIQRIGKSIFPSLASTSRFGRVWRRGRTGLTKWLSNDETLASEFRATAAASCKPAFRDYRDHPQPGQLVGAGPESPDPTQYEPTGDRLLFGEVHPLKRPLSRLAICTTHTESQNG